MLDPIWISWAHRSGTQRFWGRAQKYLSCQRTQCTRSPGCRSYHPATRGMKAISLARSQGLHCSGGGEQHPQGVCTCACVQLSLFVSFLQKLLFCLQVICPLMSYWSSAGAAPSHLLGLRSQLFLEESYWISPRCQSFRKVVLDLISFHFALYAQWITSVQRAQSVRSPGQGANLLCHHTLTWLYLI